MQVLAHINRLKMMTEELGQCGLPIHDQALMARILLTLPPSYRHFLSIWDGSPAAEKTLINLTARLVTEEERTKNTNDSHTAAAADTAFFATHPSRVQMQVAKAAQSRGGQSNT